MIIAGTRPPEYAAAVRAQQARRAAGGDSEPDNQPSERPTSAVDITPRPPAD